MTDEKRPDIVLVLTDQQRADTSEREGYGVDTTPFLDSLAAEGVWFDRAYTTSPLCCPARTSLITGRWPTAHRVTTNPAVDEAVFDTDLLTVARDAGYATALIGKNHTYAGPDDVDRFVDYMHDGAARPTDDEQAAFGDWLSSLRHRTSTEPTPFPVEVQNPHRIVDAALEWARGIDDDRPMLLVVSFPEPHNPYQVPEPYFSLFPPETLPPTATDADALEDRPYSWRYLRELGEHAVDDYGGAIARSRSNHLGMLRLIDDEVRRLHDGLEARHAVRPRVLAATADHGDYVGEYGLVRKGAEIPELLARIPMVMTGDAIRAASTGVDRAEDAHVSLADLMPTLCEAIGSRIPDGVQGRSLWPLLTGAPCPEEEFASVYVEQGMGGLPYGPQDVPDPMPGLFTDGPGGAPRFDELNAVTQSGRRRKVVSRGWALEADLTGSFRLYDVAADPLELDDRFDDPSLGDVRQALLELLAVWQLRAEDPLPIPPRGYPVKRAEHGWLAPHARLPRVPASPGARLRGGAPADAGPGERDSSEIGQGEATRARPGAAADEEGAR